MDITIIVVTSPAPSNPSTELISQSIESCDLVEGLSECPVIIVMDGFKVGPVDRTKIGRITEESAARYELYHQALLEKYASPRFRVVRNPIHQGFALSVKVGLELCTTKYCMVTQYDRMFCAPFSRLGDLIKAMEEYENIRYIGFPTSTNVSHDKFISTNYNLYCLNKPGVKLCLDDHFYLQPAVFWYDSQHLGHVERYLQIYRPYKNMPPHLRDIVGIKSIKNMLLRPGDFIEDRFGQMQRRLLWMLATKGTVTHDGDPPKVEEASELDCDSVADKSATDEATSDADSSANVPHDAVCGQDDDAIDVNTVAKTAVGELLTAPVHGDGTSVPSREEHSVSNTMDHRDTETPHTASSSSATEQQPAVNLDIVVKLFKWYGSYLCWLNSSPQPYEVHLAQEKNDTQILVRHLRGRQLNVDGIAWKLGTGVTGHPKGGYWAAAAANTEIASSGGTTVGATAETSRPSTQEDSSSIIDCSKDEC